MARATRELTTNHFIESLPPVDKVPLAGRTLASRELNVGQLADGNTVRLSLQGDGAVSTARTVASLQRNVRVLVTMLVAIMTRPISASAFGGGAAGWIAVVGETKRIRVLLDLDKADKLCWVCNRVHIV